MGSLHQQFRPRTEVVVHRLPRNTRSFGTIGVTIACNVPFNDGLATLLPQGTGAADLWDEYVTKWSAWNHVRTVAAFAAAATLTIALRV